MSKQISARAGRDLPAAIIVGIVLVGAMVSTLIYWHWGFIFFAAAMLSIGAIELHINLKRYGMVSEIYLVVIGIILTLTTTYAAAVDKGMLPWLDVLLSGLAGTVLLVLIARLRKGSNGYIRDSAASIFMIGYLSLMGAFLPMMLSGQHGAARIASFILCVAAVDTGGYVFGILWGKHPLAPKISPKKTWEGSAGSVVFASVVGALMASFFLDSPWWVGVLLGLICVIFGTCGDLVESQIKRDLNIKDMSSFLPGHGGILDRIDAMLIAAPPAWLLMYLMVPGG